MSKKAVHRASSGARKRKSTTGRQRARVGVRGAAGLLVAWSFSRWNTYAQCPKKAFYKFVEKRDEEQNDAMKRGETIHDLSYRYARGKIARCPAPLRLFAKEFLVLRKAWKSKALGTFAEGQWAFDKQWQETTYYAEPGKPVPWVRVSADFGVCDQLAKHIRVIDFKTGKIRKEHDLQLELYALAAFKKFPWVQTVNAELWYLDQGEVAEIPYARDEDEATLQTVWQKRTERMLRDKRFACKPSVLCKWCTFSEEKGGPCNF